LNYGKKSFCFPSLVNTINMHAPPLNLSSFHQSMNRCPDISNIWYTLLMKVYSYLSDTNRKYVKFITLQKLSACCDVTQLKTSWCRIIHYPVTHWTTKVRCVLWYALLSWIKFSMTKDRTRDRILTIFWLHKHACCNWMTEWFLKRNYIPGSRASLKHFWAQWKKKCVKGPTFAYSCTGIGGTRM
jgi:hypothetical protein